MDDESLQKILEDQSQADKHDYIKEELARRKKAQQADADDHKHGMADDKSGKNNNNRDGTSA